MSFQERRLRQRRRREHRWTGRARRAVAAAAALTAALVALGCGEAADPDSATPDYEPALAAAPAPLASIYADGDAVLDGGHATYDELLAKAKGFPVVVNNWASWCMPCRQEFPYFQRQSAEHLDEVLFLGVDSEDSKDAAETFLRDNPLPYPSVEAPSRRDFQEWIGRELVGYPNTVFYDADGELVYAKQGPYRDEDELAADIRRYALENG